MHVSRTFDGDKLSVLCVVTVFKVNNDPDLDDDDVAIPTANMSSSGGRRVSHAAEDEADDFDDF